MKDRVQKLESVADQKARMRNRLKEGTVTIKEGHSVKAYNYPMGNEVTVPLGNVQKRNLKRELKKLEKKWPDEMLPDHE